MVTILKGLKHVLEDLHMKLDFVDSLMIASVVGIIVAVIGSILLNRIKRDEAAEQKDRFHNVERVFAILMVFTACAMAFAHGSNDVANAVGPLAAVVTVLQTGVVGAKATMPSWILLLGGIGIVVGLATFGFKVMQTIGKKITELTPSRGFAAELGAASTVVIASYYGLPVSTTHTLVGAVLGVGIARGIGALNLGVLGGIVSSWLVTLPAGAIMSIFFFSIFKTIFA